MSRCQEYKFVLSFTVFKSKYRSHNRSFYSSVLSDLVWIGSEGGGGGGVTLIGKQRK